jgi:hypothetical protein
MDNSIEAIKSAKFAQLFLPLGYWWYCDILCVTFVISICVGVQVTSRPKVAHTLPNFDFLLTNNLNFEVDCL